MEKAEAAKTLMDGSCTAVSADGNIPAPTDAGACYLLTFPTDASVDFTATVDTTGVANVGFFTAHVPTGASARRDPSTSGSHRLALPLPRSVR